MAGAASNITGKINSWANNTQLIDTGTTPIATLSFNMDGAALPYLPQTSVGPRSAVAGLVSWNATLNMLLKIPQIGNESTIAFANGYVLNADAFTLGIAFDSLESTSQNATAPTFMTFIPGPFQWRGTWEGYLDNATAMSDIGAGGAQGAATFVYGVNSGGTDLSFAGDIKTEAGSFAHVDGTANRYTFSFVGNGDLTHAATTSGIYGNASAVAIPTIGALVLNSAGTAGTMVSGDAFPTAIDISTRVADFTTVTAQAQGSGDPNLS